MFFQKKKEESNKMERENKLVKLSEVNSLSSLCVGDVIQRECGFRELITNVNDKSLLTKCAGAITGFCLLIVESKYKLIGDYLVEVSHKSYTGDNNSFIRTFHNIEEGIKKLNNYKDKN
jgi:hypothetical protein